MTDTKQTTLAGEWEESERRAFEAWVQPHGGSVDRVVPGEYRSGPVESAWDGWQARASIKPAIPIQQIQATKTINQEELTQLIAEHLSGTLHCTRVWSAWSVGTMGESDFEDVADSDTPGELATAILAAMLVAEPTQKELS